MKVSFICSIFILSAGTQQGDVFSFAILLQEIIYRSIPYFLDTGTLTPKGKIKVVLPVQVILGQEDH